MDKNLSLYLDATRLIAALTVFLGHAAGNLTGGFLWQLNDYLSAAVMIFFVLSGYVIAFVSNEKELQLSSFAIARISRLYSVVIPAILLTIIFDTLGMRIDPNLYLNGPWPQPDYSVVNFSLSFLMLQNIWGLDLNPGINVPFWSISFELFFYLIFASAFYLKQKARIISTLVLCLIAGPDILFLLPIWLLGVLAYYTHKRFKTHKPANIKWFISIAIFFSSTLVFVVATPKIQAIEFFEFDFLISNRNFGADYIFGFIFFLNLVCCREAISLLERPLLFFSRPIRAWAGVSFSLYLFHRPLIQFLATFSEDKSSVISRLIVIGGTLLFVYYIGGWCERTKPKIKRLLERHLKKAMANNS